MIAAIAIGVLVLFGAGLVALAGLGILRLPDPLTRASAVSKAAALGLVLIIFGALIAEWSVRSLIVLLLVLIAHLVTTPLSGLALAGAAYTSGTAKSPVTVVDEPAELKRQSQPDPSQPDPLLPRQSQPRPPQPGA